MSDIVINTAALEPLFEAWEEPNFHRVRAKKEGPAEAKKGRRPSGIAIVQNLRGDVRQWRDSDYFGVSDTTRNLLKHWFGRSHLRTMPSGEEYIFRYYFCQREAIETLIYLKEVRQINILSQLIAEYSGADAEIAALGITEEEDAWGRFALKLATGTGKTKVMSLAIVWSYFHALRESDSDMAKHFVVIAPNLTVFERLKEDFGDGKIFDEDPLIPPEWRGDWNLSVVLQDEVGGVATGGTLYLTNIHRLYDLSKRRKKKDAETYDWMGPAVSRNTALDTGAALRERVTSHERVMVLNDEAHHVWDPDSSWNEAITYIHETIRKRTSGNLFMQLDLTATPKDNKGQLFKHIICDTPLGEAVDGGIVKTPVIGKCGDLSIRASDDAAFRYEKHLLIGYERWKASKEEWEKSERKALMFVMCEDTESADQITKRLNNDELFKELNGKTINLHTNLKGKVKKKGKGVNQVTYFQESEKEISDDDLKELRKLSRELDSNSTHYSCIVSVLMLREGWDVRNVTTIVPLRPYSSKANILPEQTLGRGLRRMTPTGQAHELVTVVEHNAFASLYQQELAQEGLPIELVDIDKVPATTISIFPDKEKKDVKSLDIKLPVLTAAHKTIPKLDKLELDDVKKAFEKYKRLPIGEKGETTIEYEGRALITNEIVELMDIHLPLLETGVGAISYYVSELENICKLRGSFSVLAPLIETFFEEILFEGKTSIYDQNMVARLSDSDVREHVRATFVPLIRERTIKTEPRKRDESYSSISKWRPYQVTHSERRPVIPANKTLFNLVPCVRELEQVFAEYMDKASDVMTFSKNAGPQSLRIDYLSDGKRLAFYTPDFFAVSSDGKNYLIETKGREDRDVPLKAHAAVEWCKSASNKNTLWEYVYVPQGVFEKLTGNTISDLVRSCAPALVELVQETPTRQLSITEEIDEKAPEVKGIVDQEILDSLPPRYKKSAEEAIVLFRFISNKEGMDFSPSFQALLGSLDESARGLLIRKLEDELPTKIEDQKDWFDPYYGDIDRKQVGYYRNMAQNLKRTIVFKNGLSPIGLLRSCLDYALNDKNKIDGIFEAVKNIFQVKGGREFLATVDDINEFRNSYVAHKEKDLTDQKVAEQNLITWIDGLKAIAES